MRPVDTLASSMGLAEVWWPGSGSMNFLVLANREEVELSERRAVLVVAEGVVDLVGVGDQKRPTQTFWFWFWPWLIGRKFNSLKRGEAVDEVADQLVVTKDAVGLAGVDDEQSGFLEINGIMRTFWSYMNGRALWSQLIGRKFNSLKRGKTVDEVADQLVVAEVVVGLA